MTTSPFRTPSTSLPASLNRCGAGSYADLLISASKGSMDTAVSKGYVDESTRVDMFKNDLVMVFQRRRRDEGRHAAGHR